MRDQKSAGARTLLNRGIGLFCYAIGTITLALMAASLYSEGGFKDGYNSYAIGLAFAIVSIAIGYTTEQKAKARPPEA